MQRCPTKARPFPDVRISEAGRRLFVGLLEQLSTQQLERSLHRLADYPKYERSTAGRAMRRVGRAFEDKVREIERLDLVQTRNALHQ